MKSGLKSKLQTQKYIAETLSDLIGLARRERLHRLALMLDIARLEAADKASPQEVPSKAIRATG